MILSETESRQARLGKPTPARANEGKGMKYGIGQPVRRREDVRLVTGRGRYLDDIHLAGTAYAYFVRSPHAHAIIRGIDASEARRAPGVIGVLTAADLPLTGTIPVRGVFKNRDG